VPWSVLNGRSLVVVGVFSGVWVGWASEFVVFLDVIVFDERFGVELSHAVVVLLHNGTSHETC
jgi:hypothetical protein